MSEKIFKNIKQIEFPGSVDPYVEKQSFLTSISNEIILNLPDDFHLMSEEGRVYQLSFDIQLKDNISQNFYIILRNDEEDFIFKKYKISQGTGYKTISEIIYPQMLNRINATAFTKIIIKIDESINPYLELKLKNVVVRELRNFLTESPRINYLFATSKVNEGTLNIIINDEVFEIGSDLYLEIIEDLEVYITFIGYEGGSGYVTYKY